MLRFIAFCAFCALSVTVAGCASNAAPPAKPHLSPSSVVAHVAAPASVATIKFGTSLQGSNPVVSKAKFDQPSRVFWAVQLSKAVSAPVTVSVTRIGGLAPIPLQLWSGRRQIQGLVDTSSIAAEALHHRQGAKEKYEVLYTLAGKTVASGTFWLGAGPRSSTCCY